MTDIITIQNVRGYCDEQGTAWLNAEDVARKLGWTQEKNGVEYVRWETINGYLAEFGFSQRVGKDSFIPENMFYRLGLGKKPPEELPPPIDLQVFLDALDEKANQNPKADGARKSV